MLCYVCTPVEMKRNAQVVSYMFLAGEDDEAARTAALPRRRISLQSPGIFRVTAAAAAAAKTNKNEVRETTCPPEASEQARAGECGRVPLEEAGGQAGQGCTAQAE